MLASIYSMLCVIPCVEVFEPPWQGMIRTQGATLRAGKQLGGTAIRALRQCSLLLVGVYFLSPLYSTLTKAVSDDTIVAASVWLLLAHLYMHDYFFVTSVAAKLTGSLSLAAAVAASLLLASRLNEPDKVVRCRDPSVLASCFASLASCFGTGVAEQTRSSNTQRCV